MACVTNTTKGDVGLGPGIVIAGGESTEIKDETLTQLRKGKVVKSYFEDGLLTVAEQPKPKTATVKKPKLKTRRSSNASIQKQQ